MNSLRTHCRRQQYLRSVQRRGCNIQDFQLIGLSQGATPENRIAVQQVYPECKSC